MNDVHIVPSDILGRASPYPLAPFSARRMRCVRVAPATAAAVALADLRELRESRIAGGLMETAIRDGRVKTRIAYRPRNFLA